MPSFSKSEVALSLKESGLIPVFNHTDIETCKSILKACHEGGLRVFEFTNRSASALQVFTELSAYAHKNTPDMLLGAGSILDGDTTTDFIEAGARFIVSPALVPEIAEVCNREEILWIPGCGTVSEIVQAQNLKAEIIKLFPATEIGGSAFVKAVLGPMPWTQLMPSGGVSPDEDNLKAWFDAGVSCVGMGSKLFPKEWIRERKFSNITKLVENTIRVINQIRNDSTI